MFSSVPELNYRALHSGINSTSCAGETHRERNGNQRMGFAAPTPARFGRNSDTLEQVLLGRRIACIRLSRPGRRNFHDRLNSNQS